MRTPMFVLALIVALAVWGLLNFYIFWRLKPIMPHHIWFYVIFWILAYFYPLGRTVEGMGLNAHIPIVIGGIVIGLQVYLFFGFFLSEFVRLALGFTGRSIPDIGVAWIVLISVLIVFIAGFVNSMIPVTRRLTIEAEGIDNGLRIAFASDLHLGHVVGRGRAEKLAEMMAKEKPDVILFGGDIVDEDVKPVMKKDMAAPFHELHPKYGVIAVPGNHEHIGGAEKNIGYLRKSGMTVLRDSSVVVGDFVIAGREDLSAHYFGAPQRKPIEDMLPKTDRPIILLDHQPKNLEPARDNGVFLQLSGHTHHGQMWPLNYITGTIYKLSRGYLQLGDTHYYVSSGYGTWGPPLRLGSRPELVIVDIKPGQ